MILVDFRAKRIGLSSYLDKLGYFLCSVRLVCIFSYLANFSFSSN
jgi:hypothetical protein